MKEILSRNAQQTEIRSATRLYTLHVRRLHRKSVETGMVPQGENQLFWSLLKRKVSAGPVFDKEAYSAVREAELILK